MVVCKQKYLLLPIKTEGSSQQHQQHQPHRHRTDHIEICSIDFIWGERVKSRERLILIWAEQRWNHVVCEVVCFCAAKKFISQSAIVRKTVLCIVPWAFMHIIYKNQIRSDRWSAPWRFILKFLTIIYLLFCYFVNSNSRLRTRTQWYVQWKSIENKRIGKTYIGFKQHSQTKQNNVCYKPKERKQKNINDFIYCRSSSFHSIFWLSSTLDLIVQ